jgi:hypothetical protein
MSRLLWVALPLLMLAPLAGWLVLRRRPAWRLTLNVWSSLLLLAYLATTAGLGIFWVASQHLPVFDWHYLFGYMTLLLLALHLTLNLGAVWRFFKRPAPKPAGAGAAGTTGTGVVAMPPGATVSGRRPVLGALGGLGAWGAFGGLAALGAAFGLGQRHERRRAGNAAAAGGAPRVALAGLAAVEHYHALSSHARADMLRRAPLLDWGAAPAPFKHYPQAERIALPPPGRVASSDAGRVAFSDAGTPLGLAALAAALWHTAGVTARRGGLALRASPSSGALFSTELYVAATAVAGLAAGLWPWLYEHPPRLPVAVLVNGHDLGSWLDELFLTLQALEFGHRLGLAAGLALGLLALALLLPLALLCLLAGALLLLLVGLGLPLLLGAAGMLLVLSPLLLLGWLLLRATRLP